MYDRKVTKIMEAFISDFVGVTGAPRDIARYYRSQFRDVQRALDQYFEDGSPQDLTPTQRATLDPDTNNERPPAHEEVHNEPPEPVLREDEEEEETNADEGFADDDYFNNEIANDLSTNDVEEDATQQAETQLRAEAGEPSHVEEGRKNSEHAFKAKIIAPVHTKMITVTENPPQKLDQRATKGESVVITLYKNGCKIGNDFYNEGLQQHRQVMNALNGCQLDIPGLEDVCDIELVDLRQINHE